MLRRRAEGDLVGMVERVCRPAAAASADRRAACRRLHAVCRNRAAPSPASVHARPLCRSVIPLAVVAARLSRHWNAIVPNNRTRGRSTKHRWAGIDGTIGVGLIGTGYMGKCHALGVECGQAGVRRRRAAAPCSSRRGRCGARRKTRADEFGFEHSTGDWRDLVADRESTWSRSPRRTSSMPRWRSPRSRPASTSGARSRWRRPRRREPMREAARARRQGRGPRLQLHPEPGDPADRWSARRGASATVNHIRVEMDEDYMADPTRPSTGRARRTRATARSTISASIRCRSSRCSLAPSPASCAHQTKPYADRPLQEAAAAPSRITTSQACCSSWSSGASGVMALNRAAWGRKGRIALQIFGSQGLDPLRSGALQRAAALSPPKAARRAGFPHDPDRARTIRLTTASFLRPATASASTTSRSSSATN